MFRCKTARRWTVALALALGLLAARSAPAQEERERSAAAWRAVLESASAAEAGRALERASVQPWPSVSGREGDPFLGVAEALPARAASWLEVESGRTPDPAGFDLLLRLHGQVTAQAGYENLLIGDALARVAVVVFAKALTRENAVQPWLERTAQLNAFAVRGDPWRTLFAELQEQKPPPPAPEPGGEFYGLLAAAAGVPLLEALALRPEPIAALVRKPDLPRLMLRHLETDRYRAVAIPLLARYRSAGGAPRSELPFPDVVTLLKLGDADFAALGSPINRARPGSENEIVFLMGEFAGQSAGSTWIAQLLR